jgi:DNA-binding CsgD family transcriptional regulator
MRKKLSLLSKSDLVSLSEIAYRSLTVRSRLEMENLLGKVSDLVPTTGILSGHASVDPRNFPVLNPKCIVNGGFPRFWLSLYLERGFHRVDPVFQKHFREYGTQVWTQTYRTVTRKEEKAFIDCARNFGLEEGVTMGYLSPFRTAGSSFSFSGSEIPRHERHIQLLECLTPHLHAAISGLFFPLSFSGTSPALTARETEVLSWKKEGRTAWEISQSMKISERTVVFHLRNAMRKLGARNSAQAMATALSLGLIH